MKLIADGFGRSRAQIIDVTYDNLPRETVELFAALGHTDAKAWLKAHPVKET